MTEGVFTSDGERASRAPPPLRGPTPIARRRRGGDDPLDRLLSKDRSRPIADVCKVRSQAEPVKALQMMDGADNAKSSLFQAANEVFADILTDGADIALIDIECPMGRLNPAACFEPSCRTG